MHNVAEQRRGTLGHPVISEGLNALPQMLGDFAPAPTASDRAFWDAVDPRLSTPIVIDAERQLSVAWPTLPAALYRAFTETGDRAGFEQLYFERRRRLNTLALAEAVENKGRFVDAMIDGIMLICEESGWQLPAHNSQVRDGRHDPLPDPERPVIDLFAAETGAQLAVLAYLHAETLAKTCPEVVQRIDREIESRITRPYLDRHFWWMGNGVDRMINWTPWITQNVLLSLFARSNDQGTRRAALARAANSLDEFMAAYGDDGACDEGPLYYRHAALCLFGALRIMDEAAPGAFSFMWSEPKLRNMADFIRNVHVAGRTYINFADCSAVLPACTAREYLFGKSVASDALATFAAADSAEDARPDQPDEVNLWYRLQALTAAAQMASDAGEATMPADIYYESCGLFVARDDTFTLAAKAGNNDDGHNHNDVGSVTLYKNGLPVLIDLGVETYTKKTFSPDRYDLWTMQSAWHNLPSFEGVGQKAGPEFAARDVSVSLGGAQARIDMDIAPAYPAEAGVVRYHRAVVLDKGNAVTITDGYEGTKPAVLSLITVEKPAVSGGRITLGDVAAITLSGAGDITTEAVSISDPRLLQAWPDTLHRILVPLAGNELRLTII